VWFPPSTDEVCDVNSFKGVRIRANDRERRGKPRPIRVFSFEEMHRFAKAAGRYEAMVHVFTDCGMRLRGRPTTASPTPIEPMQRLPAGSAGEEALSRSSLPAR
jgi:hypothetical protein